MQAMIFDLDHTLVYTDHAYVRDICSQALQKCGGTATEQDLRHLWFLSDDAVYERVGVSSHQFWEELRAIDTPERRMQATLCFDDIGALVDLQSLGYKLGIVTGARPIVAEKEIELIRKKGVEIDHYLCAHSHANMKPKPDPECLHKILSQLTIPNHEACYVGDTLNDVLTARNAQVADVLIDRDDCFANESVGRRVRSLYDLLTL